MSVRFDRLIAHTPESTPRRASGIIARVVLLATLSVVLAATSCRSPLEPPGNGQVLIDLSAASRTATIPAVIESYSLTVTADDMATIERTLAADAAATALEIPAGADRVFTITAMSANDEPEYRGTATLDIVAGAEYRLPVTMVRLYKLIYDMNGGDAEATPATAYLVDGEATSVAAHPASDDDSTRLGYYCTGWNTAADGSGQAYPGGSTYTSGAANQTLYAQWEPRPYSINYVLIDSPYYYVSNLNVTTYNIETPTITLIPPVWETEGYTFIGWYSDAGYTIPVTSIPVGSTGNIQLYARWDVYRLSFDANGGSGVLYPRYWNWSNTIYLDTNNAYKFGYNLTEWDTQANGGGISYSVYNYYDFGTDNLKLYAQWSPRPLYVYFDSQGGTPPAPSSLYITFNSTYGSGGAFPVVTRDGYTFLGWYDTYGNRIEESTVMSIQEWDHYLYAYWRPDFAAGSGSYYDPFIVYTVDDLKNVQYFPYSYFRLGANLDLVSEFDWLPIGSSASPFYGNFDGMGYTISNLTINNNIDPDRGLFGYVSNATISNMNLVNINIITTYNYAGGLVGSAAGNTTITNCSVQGVINGYQCTGGILGQGIAGSYVHIEDCHTDVDITSNAMGAAGGIAGYVLGGYIYRCSAIGDVYINPATADHAGGLVGYNSDTLISNSYALGAVTGKNNVGGLVGYNTGTGNDDITYCYSAGVVTGTSNYGGLVGILAGTGIVTSSYYDTDTSTQIDNDGRGVPKTTMVMQDAASAASNYVGWDFATIWDIVNGYYPTLR